MGVSALRVAACAGLLLGGLMLGASTAGLAIADPGGARHGPSNEQSSKGVNNEHASLPHAIRRILSEHRKRARTHTRDAPQAKIGSKPDSDFTASESNVAPFAEVDEEPAPEVAPEVAPDDERGADPAGTEEGAGADGVDPVDGRTQAAGATTSTTPSSASRRRRRSSLTFSSASRSRTTCWNFVAAGVTGGTRSGSSRGSRT